MQLLVGQRRPDLLTPHLLLGLALLVAIPVASAKAILGLVLVWVLSPVFARWMSLPLKDPQEQVLTPDETRALRLVARRTWRFFETFVDQEEHALPPDNFQEDPEPVRADRTSPTNMGLYLLSAMAAHDFG